MSCDFEIITGRAGAGATTELFGRIRKARAAGTEVFLIVPEQATFETERRLSDALGGGLFGCTVTSWKGLARKVLDSMGVKRAFLSGEGRLMLVRRAADYVAKDLTVFKKSAARRGFPAECDSLIAKFKRCGMCAEDVKRAAESFEEHDPLRDRLSDVALVFSELERRCLDRYIDSDDMVRELAARMEESPLVGAGIFIDGGDTMHEYAYPVLSAMLDHASSVTCTLTLDSCSPDRGLFSEEEFTLAKLKEIAEEKGAPVRVTRLAERRRKAPPALVHLEKELFRPSPSAFDGVPKGLSIYAAADRLDEVTEAAERIRRAAEAGMSWKDMAVIVSDPEGYAPLIARVFPSCSIDYFADRTRKLVTHPAARLVLAALEAVEKGFDASSVLEAVKSGYLDVTPDEAELFENYILKTGISGTKLLEPFTDEGEELEDVRKRALKPLVSLAEGLKPRDSASRTRAIHAFLDETDIYGKQRALCAGLHEKGLFREEEESAQVVNTVLEVLDQLYVIMGDDRIGLKRFISVVREGFETHTVGAIPSTLDQVTVGSVERTRMSEVKLIIVLGMNEGLFPKPRKDEGVIDDGDLLRLKEKGFELWKSSKRLSDGDLLSVYRAFAKATEELVLSYPVSIVGAGAMDSAASPCKLLSAVEKAFPLIERIDGSMNEKELAVSGRSEELAFYSLAGRIRRMIDSGVPDPEAAELASWFSRRPEFRTAFKRMTDSLYGEAALKPLGSRLAASLYGRTIFGSASRLESFNSCPFRHFLQYGLRAAERDERREKNTDLGSFYHEALEAYVRCVMENDLDWTEIDDKKTEEILREIMPPIMNRKGGWLLYDTARQRARLVNVVETVKFTCCALTRQIARGRFRPEDCEVSFGREDSTYPPLRIEAGGAVFYIKGVIDRLDRAGSMTRIIDYKSGGKDFDFAELKAGLQLQLPLYAAAVNAAENVAMYYMPIRDIDPVTDGEDGETKKEFTEELLKDFRLSGVTLREAEVIEATEEFDKSSTVVKVKYVKDGALTGSGLVSRDELGSVLDFAKDKAANTLERILGGEIAISPARLMRTKKIACRFCPYMDVCLFDPELSKEGTRDIRPMGAEGFFGREKSDE